MKEEILKKLAEMEEEHGITILYACESGSRAWGFASPDSDYDVRFIYKHSLDWYLSIDDRKDVVELPVNEVLDINGWDIRKALKLFRNSNAPLYEWLQSPIVYKENAAFLGAMKGRMPDYFSLRAGLHHYASMARNTFLNDLQNEQVRLKKYFYALRPLLAATWIVKKNALPPMEFSYLRTLIDDQAIQQEIDGLLAKKVAVDEKSTMRVNEKLNSFISEGLIACDIAAKDLDRKEVDTGALNSLFRSCIHDY